MFRRLFQLIVGVAGGVALASYVRSDRGRDALRRAAELLRGQILRAQEGAATETDRTS
jgi:type II secretory pathway pseudopilin PulG